MASNKPRMRPQSINAHIPVTWSDAGVDYTSTRNAANYLGVTRCRITQLSSQGRIVGARHVGTDWFLPIASLRAFALTPRRVGRPIQSAPPQL